MKLERYKDKKETRKKVILIGLTVVTIVSITMMLYKTFAKFTATTSFPIMSGKVKYKKKGKNFTDVVQTTTSGDGLYSVDHSGASGGWDQAELRYAGKNPNNYVYFNCDNGKKEDSTNCELWRIIGKVNVKTNSNTIEQRIKLIRNESLGNYSWDYQGGSWENDWTQASLMGMLNDTYYYSKDDSTYCYSGSGTPSTTACRFSSSKPKGLTEKARDMIETDTLSWNIGGAWGGTASVLYESERGTEVYPGRPTEWKAGNTKDPSTGSVVTSLFRGVGLMYPSDYGYAVGGYVRSECLAKSLDKYDQTNCYTNDWLYLSGTTQLLLTPYPNRSSDVFKILSSGYVLNRTGAAEAQSVRPVIFLNGNVKIGEGTGSDSDPYHLVM